MSPTLLEGVNGDVPLYSPFPLEHVAAGEVVNRSAVAALAFLVWDILITTDEEIKYIWPRNWTFTKYVYFIVRYFPVLVQISLLFIGSELTPHFHFTPRDCFIWQVYQGASGAVMVMTVDTILILRVNALYHDHRIIRRLIAVCFALEIIGMAIGLSLALPGIICDDVCLVVVVPRTMIIYGASSLIFQVLLFGLTLFKFIQSVKSDWGDVPIIAFLMREGTWAFFLIFCVYVSQGSFYVLPNSPYIGILYGWLLTTFSFSGYRILLNLNHFAGRTGHTRQSCVGSSFPTDTHIQFSPNSRRDTQEEESYELPSSHRHLRNL